MKNAYFQLIVKENETSIKLFPAQGGEPLRYNEVRQYLEDRKIAFDAKLLYDQIEVVDAVKVVKLNNSTVYPERESFELQILDNRMKAVVRFYAPSEGGEVMSEQEFIRDLASKGIRFGVDVATIDSFFNKKDYCTDYTVAVGEDADHGSDAVIEYYFNTDLRAKPTLNEDGSVDFFHLNNINHVARGTCLAKLTPAVQGTPGRSVMGEIIPPRTVRNAVFHYGRNITLKNNEDGTSELYTDVDGHVTLVQDQVFVSDVLEVENVDTATGNIEYEGSVRVNGNVCSNFSVKAKGNIEVRGVVEGAFLEAGGDVVIVRGMNGMGKGTIRAGGNVITKFLESANVTAEGYVSSDSILYSTVVSRCDVTVSGKRGFISGGRICALKHVSVKNLGSKMGADTIIEVGTDPERKEKIAKLQKVYEDAEKNAKSADPILMNFEKKIKSGVRLTPQQAKYVESLLNFRKEKQAEAEETLKQITEMEKAVVRKDDAYVIVEGDVYPGTKICISDVSMILHEPLRRCQFVYVRGDVKARSL